MKHDEDCTYPSIGDTYGAVGVRVYHCWGCGAIEHEPLRFKDAGYLDHLSRWPDLEHTPYGHESGLLDLNCYSLDHTFRRPAEDRRPLVVRNPVSIAFYPEHCIQKDDAKQHEGISFRQLWDDLIARTLWLGYKPFMITSQHFRSGCINHADWLRKHPEELLGERVSFGLDSLFSYGPGMTEIGAQLVPYLMWALWREDRWPYFRLPNLQPLAWETIAEEKAA